jgi:archaellum component FlaC
MQNYDNLSKFELQEKIKELKDLFEEVTEERTIILSQQNLHLSSKLVTKYQNELDDIQANIKRLGELLEQKS